MVIYQNKDLKFIFIKDLSFMRFYKDIVYFVFILVCVVLLELLMRLSSVLVVRFYLIYIYNLYWCKVVDDVN